MSKSEGGEEEYIIKWRVPCSQKLFIESNELIEPSVSQFASRKADIASL